MTRWLMGVLVGAALVHLAAVAATPWLIMRVATRAVARAAANDWFHTPLATSEARAIVRPSPDLAYSSLAFDVSEHALQLNVPLSAPYTSLSGFAANTDNFFAVNDRTAGGPEIAVAVVGPRTPRDGLEGLRVVESPSDRGILLVRRVVPNAESFAAIDALRRQATAKLR